MSRLVIATICVTAALAVCVWAYLEGCRARAALNTPPPTHPAAKALRARSRRPLTGHLAQWDAEMNTKTSPLPTVGNRWVRGITSVLLLLRYGRRISQRDGRKDAGAPAGLGGTGDAGSCVSPRSATSSEGATE
jgi:hypothetical protein